MKKFSVAITGSTGMVGKGVLLQCLDDATISQIILINRSAHSVKHNKIREVLLNDFTQMDQVADQIGAVDACFHCMGVSSVGLSEKEYEHYTFDITKSIADVMYSNNAGMTFNYVSGTGTDSTEAGRIMWAHIKGKTENYCLNKGFKQAIMFRPGVILPERGIRSRTGWYNTIYALTRPLFPLFRKSDKVTTTTKLGDAMIYTVDHTIEQRIIHNPEINRLAHNYLALQMARTEE